MVYGLTDEPRNIYLNTYLSVQYNIQIMLIL